MPPLRSLVRTLLGLLIVASCMAVPIVPMLGRVAAAPSHAPSAAPGDIVIAAFRFSGPNPNGEGNEYVELFNRSCDIANPVSVGGWTVHSSDGSGSEQSIYTFPTGITIASGHYYLLGGPTYSGTGAASADASYSPGIPSATGGVAIFSNTNPTTPVDQAGFSANDFYEANVLSALPANTDESYVRKLSGSMSNPGMFDSNNNAADFVTQNPSVPLNKTQTGTCGIPTQTISGNAGVAGATITVLNADGTNSTATADGSGVYTVTIPSNWTGTITPSLAGYTFSPASISYTVPVTNPVSLSFTASQFTPTSTPVPQYGSVVINEVGWAGTGASTADKWIELYNTQSYPIDLGGWTLSDRYDVIGTGGILTFTKSGSPGGNTEPIIPANGFFVIARDMGVFQGLTPDYTDVNLSNLPSCYSYCGDKLYLNAGPDLGSQPMDTANASSYYWLAGSLTGRRSMERAGPGGPLPDSSFAWLTYVGSPAPPACPAHPNVRDRNGNAIQGTPGCPNWSTIVTATPPPTATRYKTPTPFPPTPFAHMVLNEILPRAGFDWDKDGKVDVYDEFVEIKNLGPINASLSGWRIDVISPGGSSAYILPTITLTPGQRAVYFSSTSKLSLWDSGGTVRLINNRGVVIDAYTYGPAENADQSTCRIPDGRFWTFPCVPTPGDENTVIGSVPTPPTQIAPACLLADTVPLPFKLAECYGFGADVYNPKYWDDQSGFSNFPVPDVLNKGDETVK